MVHLSDNELIRYCQQGNMEAFQQLVERYQTKIFWVAYQMVGNHEEARDISQEAFVRVYRSISKFNLTSNFYTWLYRIVVNLCIDFLRKQKPTNKAVSFEEVGEVKTRELPIHDTLEKQELSQEVNEILNELPIQYRVILILRDIEGLSCKEIEQIVNCNHNTVRWRLFRSRQLFKELWEKRKKGE